MRRLLTPQILLHSALVVAALAITPGMAYASGSYAGGPPPIPKPQPTVHGEMYELGQMIYMEKVDLPAADSTQAQVQTPSLTQLQKSLANAGVKKDLVSLSGRLTPAQLKALESYVHTRYMGK
jgi:hypothetical protein